MIRQRYLCLSNRVSVFGSVCAASERRRKGPARERGPNENTLILPVPPVITQGADRLIFAQRDMSSWIRLERASRGPDWRHPYIPLL
jgi:hypothetical protein